MGHALGLHHTWGQGDGSCDAGDETTINKQTTDFVPDTQHQTIAWPTDSNSKCFSDACVGDTSTLLAGSFSPTNPTSNVMSYCNKGGVTSGQAQFMLETVARARPTLYQRSAFWHSDTECPVTAARAEGGLNWTIDTSVTTLAGSMSVDSSLKLTSALGSVPVGALLEGFWVNEVWRPVTNQDELNALDGKSGRRLQQSTTECSNQDHGAADPYGDGCDDYTRRARGAAPAPLRRRPCACALGQAAARRRPLPPTAGSRHGVAATTTMTSPRTPCAVLVVGGSAPALTLTAARTLTAAHGARAPRPRHLPGQLWSGR